MRRVLSLLVAVGVACGGSGGSGTAADGGGLGGTGGTSSCVPGQQVACACGGGAEGYQACKQDGSGYDPCVCADGGVGGTGGATGGTGGATGGTGPDACVPVTVVPAVVPSDLVLVLDQSASMLDQGKWQGVTGALWSFFAASSPGKLSLALTLFPAPATGTIPSACTSDAQCGVYGPCQPIFNQCAGSLAGNDSCVAADYATPKVAMVALPSTQLTQALPATPNGSSTPMTAALQGALTYASGWAAAHADHLTSLLLLTDGEPTNCNPNDVQSAAAAAAAGLSGNPSVKTHVIAVGALSSLDAIAQAGGTGKATLVAPGSTQAASDALSKLRRTLACRFAVPKQVQSAPALGVSITLGGTTTPVPKVADAAACGSGAGAYFDAPVAPTSVELCPASCDAASQASALLELVAPCSQ